MMIARFVAALFVVVGSQADAVTLFLDLNNAPKEIDACCQGMKDGGIDSELTANNCSLLVARPANDERGSGKRALLQKMKMLCDAGIRVENIVISGESTSDNVWGEFGNFSSKDLKDLRAEFESKTTCSWFVESLSMPACYSGTRYNSQKFWVNDDTGVEVSMAYAAQSPSKERPQLHKQLKWNCQNHKELVKRSAKDELCEFVRNMNIPAFGESNMSICSVTGVYSQLYKTGSKDPWCHTNEELAARCDQLRQDSKKTGAWRDVYDKYYAAEDDDFADPHDEEYWKEKENDLSPVRKAYNEAQLARDCYESESPGDDGGAMDVPSNAKFLRLTKFGWLKRNMASGAKTAIGNYNSKVPEEMAIDLESDSRRTLREKIDAAIEHFSNGGDRRKLRMAVCMRETFIELNPDCSKFKTLKEGGGNVGSACLKTLNNTSSDFYNEHTGASRKWRATDGCRPHN